MPKYDQIEIILACGEAGHGGGCGRGIREGKNAWAIRGEWLEQVRHTSFHFLSELVPQKGPSFVTVSYNFYNYKSYF